HLSVQCDCGARLADHLAPELESTLPLPVAHDASGAPRSVDAAAFIAWHERADAVLTDTTRPPPTVSRAWLPRPAAPGRTRPPAPAPPAAPAAPSTAKPRASTTPSSPR